MGSTQLRPGEEHRTVAERARAACALQRTPIQQRRVRTRFRDYGYLTEMGRTLNGAVPAAAMERTKCEKNEELK